MCKKGDLSHFGMVVGVGLSIAETADLLEFSHTTISRVYRDLYNYQTSNTQFYGWKCQVEENLSW